VIQGIGKEKLEETDSHQRLLDSSVDRRECPEFKASIDVVRGTDQPESTTAVGYK
jgi:hypothetical protein